MPTLIHYTPSYRTPLLLTAATGLALALMAFVISLTFQIHAEARVRETLHSRLSQANNLLAAVNDTAAMTSLPQRLAQTFDHIQNLSVRVQGPTGQPLYEKTPEANIPQSLLAQPALAPPALLMRWQTDTDDWQGCAQLIRMPMTGSAALTVVVAVRSDYDSNFLRRFQRVLLAYVLGATTLFGTLAWRICHVRSTSDR